jgi:hypothetical protein
MRLGFISPGDWPDGLERQGSNPWPTTKQSRISLGVKRHVANVQSPVQLWYPAPQFKGEQSWGCDSIFICGYFVGLG